MQFAATSRKKAVSCFISSNCCFSAQDNVHGYRSSPASSVLTAQVLLVEFMFTMDTLKLNHCLTSVACVEAPAPDGRHLSLLGKRPRTWDHDGQTPKWIRTSAEHQSASTTLYPQSRCRSHSPSSVHGVAGYNHLRFQHNIDQSRTQDVHGVLGGIEDDVRYQSVVDGNSSSEAAPELGYRSVSTEMDDAGRDHRSHMSV